MKIHSFFLFLFFVVIFTNIQPVAGIDVTFSDMQIIKGVKILVYNNTGTFQGEYNTTDTVTLDPAQSYIFIFKPTEQSWFNNPMNALELLKAQMPIMLSYMLFAVVILGSAFLITRIWK